MFVCKLKIPIKNPPKKRFIVYECDLTFMIILKFGFTETVLKRTIISVAMIFGNEQTRGIVFSNRFLYIFFIYVLIRINYQRSHKHCVDSEMYDTKLGDNFESPCQLNKLKTEYYKNYNFFKLVSLVSLHYGF